MSGIYVEDLGGRVIRIVSGIAIGAGPYPVGIFHPDTPVVAAFRKGIYCRKRVLGYRTQRIRPEYNIVINNIIGITFKTEEKTMTYDPLSQETDVAPLLTNSQPPGNFNIQPGGGVTRKNNILEEITVSPNHALREERIEIKAVATRPINSLIVRFSGPRPFDVALEPKRANEDVSEWSYFVDAPSIPGIYQYRAILNLDDGISFEDPVDSRNFLEVRP